jgi:metallophosphoesterase (TIGR03767 family)
MDLSRRNVLRGGLAVGAVSALGLPPLLPSAAAEPVAPAGTTLERTYRIASREGRPGGYAPVLVGPGEPHRLNTTLARAIEGRETRRQTVLNFAQLSDVHIVDAQSPMRLEWADRFDDQDAAGDPTTGLTSSAYRPQEMLSIQVADAMVRQINSIGVGPVSGERLSLAIQTGDNADNTQLNETRWNIDVLDGGTLTPDSGDLTRWEGVADTNGWWYDVHYWHPDGRPGVLRPFDLPRTKYGFPLVPGLLDAARKPFAAQGLNMPWYTAFGNHDGLVQGNFPPGSMGLATNAVAMGRLKLISPPPGTSQSDLFAALRGDYLGLLNSLSPTYVRKVSPDQNRRILHRHEVVAEHFATTGTPVGHGFSAENLDEKTAYYTFDHGAIRFIVLDTVNPNGYADGSLDDPQFTWLAAQLAAVPVDKYVVICSHHTSETMNNPLIVTGLDLKPRVLGPAVVDLLLSQPKVIAWVNGHSHVNRIWARSAAGKPGRFWEINTASHCDFPQQSRLIEVFDNLDGTLSIFTTMVDHAGPASYGGNINNPVSLAGLARELSANDWQDRGVVRTGSADDRNVELLLPKP